MSIITGVWVIDKYYLPIIFCYKSMRLTSFIFSIVFKHVAVSISFKIINVLKSNINILITYELWLYEYRNHRMYIV